ncbi:MAG TPA: ATP-binding protein [Rhodoblastus sp.]|nr:ATP-binding protein [Rhodoblastus sp.]
MWSVARGGLRAALFALALFSACLPAAQCRAAPVELGRDAARMIDRAGNLTVEQLAADPGLFEPSDGRPANFGARGDPHAAMWLRIDAPVLDAAARTYVLSTPETRVRAFYVFAPGPGGWTRYAWDEQRGASTRAATTRFPSIHAPRDAISGKTLYIRVGTASSMRGLIFLQTEREFAASYAASNFVFSIAAGMLASLAIYLVATGWAAGDRALVTLGAFSFAYLCYLLSQLAFVETIILPGARELSRAISTASTFWLFTAWAAFTNIYLDVRRHRPLVARGLAALAVVCFVASFLNAASTLAEWNVIFPRATPILGVTTLLAGFAAALSMIAPTPRRAIVYLLCWSPGIAAGVLRLSFDLFPALGANYLALNATYLATCFCLLVFGIAISVEMYRRELALRHALSATGDRLRDFAESVADSFWETDASGRVTFASGRTSAVLGLAPGVDLAARLRPHLPADDAPAFAGAPARTLLTAGAQKLELRGTPRLDPTGTLIGYRGVLSDLTQDLEEQERRAQQQKLAAIGQLAGGVAHEINNLLHPIVNLARRATDRLDPADAEGRRWLTIVVESGERAAQIVASLLRSVRPAAGRQAPQPLRLSLERALAAIRAITPAGVSLSLASDGAAGPDLLEQDVFQVVANLVSNAVQATSGAGRVVVDLRRSAGPAGDRFTLSVTDNGCGMADDVRQKALEPFFTTRAIGEGHGLGLFVVYEIVRKWNGEIAISSSPGAGATVAISIPANPSQAEFPDAHSRH